MEEKHEKAQEQTHGKENGRSLDLAYEKAVAYLYGIPKFTQKQGLWHTREMLRRLHIDDSQFRIIHVAGSNGKGSVCSAVSEILVRAGKRTGLFISPHLIRVEERFCVDGRPCSQQVFLSAFHAVGEVAKQMQGEGMEHPTFFEYLFAMGMWIFSREQVEYLVLETGLGGRLDCTNVVSRPLATAITSISLEHTEYLGDTIAQIALEKAGIIKEHVPVVYDASSPEASEVISCVAKERQSPCYPVLNNSLNFYEIHEKCIDFYISSDYDETTKIAMPFLAPYQMMNMAIAYRLMRLIEPVTGIGKPGILDGIRHCKWPGRMQEVSEGVYLDGAHNPAGIRSFLEAVALMKPEKPGLLFAMASDKDYQEAVRLLAKGADWGYVVVTSMKDARGVAAKELEKVFAEYGCKVIRVDHSWEACQEALGRKKDGQALYCTGSLYFVGELLSIMDGRK